MSRTIMTFNPKDEMSIEIDADTLERFQIPPIYLHPIDPESHHSMPSLRTIECGFKAINDEQDVVLEMREFGNVIESIDVDEKELCQALFDGIYREGRVIEDIQFINDLKKKISETYSQRCFEEKTGNLYGGITYEGFGLIFSGEDRVIGTVDNLRIHERTENDILGFTLEKCVGALDLNIVPDLNIAFGSGNGLIVLRDITMDELSGEETCRYTIHAATAAYRRHADELPQVAPYGSFIDDEEFVASRLQHITTETEDNSDEFEDLL